MRRRFSFVCVLLVMLTLFNFNFVNASADEKIYLGGTPAGFTLATNGVEIVGLSDVITDKGVESPAKNADLRVGDFIVSINDVKILSFSDIEKAILEKNNIILLRRNGENVIKSVDVVKDFSGKFRLGVLIKDSVSGIGTITYIKGSRFASLGHPILDDNGNIIETVGGNVYSCSISGCVKGERGKAGELKGVFLRKNSIGTIEKNICCGVYGSISNNSLKQKEILIGNAVPGDANIYTTIAEDGPKEYSISIIKADNDVDGKNFVIKITDKELIDATGGIVQGMSGSPIIQNGKLVGAVTHVFINDPTRGFGINIYNMINN